MGNLFSRNARSSRGREAFASPLATSISNATCPNPNRSPSNVSEESNLSTETFQQFYSKLVETLPMDDPNLQLNYIQLVFFLVTLKNMLSQDHLPHEQKRLHVFWIKSSNQV